MAEKILMKGNEAIAISAIRNGADGYFGYPITPQSEVMETLMKERLRSDWISEISVRTVAYCRYGNRFISFHQNLFCHIR